MLKISYRLIFLVITLSFLKLNSQNLQWVKQFSSCPNEWGREVVLDVNENVYTIGSFQDTIDFDPGPGIYSLTCNGVNDAFITKHNSVGNIIWAKKIGGTGNEVVSGIFVDISENVYLTGTFEGTVDFDPGIGIFNLTSIGSSDVFILKLSPIGNFIWAKRIGGVGYEYSTSIKVSGSGNIYASGAFSLTADFDPNAGVNNLTANAGPNSGMDSYILKLDPNGNFVWVKQFWNSFFSIELNQNEEVFFAGHFWWNDDFDPGPASYTIATTNSVNAFVAKLNSQGDFSWAKRIGGTGDSEVKDIAFDNIGNIYLTGGFALTLDCDPGPGTFTLSNPNVDLNYDIFICKLNSLGDFVMAKQLGGVTDDQVTSICLDGAGNIYTAGFFSGTADFDPGVGTYTLATSGYSDIFINKLNSAGDFVWTKQFGNSTFNIYENIQSITATNSGELYGLGWFDNTVDFDPNLGVYDLTAKQCQWATGSDVFLIKLGSDPFGFEEFEKSNNYYIYPNPFTNELIIDNDGNEGINSIKVYDVSSRLLNEINLQGVKGRIVLNEMGDLNKGIYFLEMKSENSSRTLKLIKQ